MSEQWLKCWVFKGMFSDELAVEVRSLPGKDVSVFVPRIAVQGREDEEGRVRVRVFRQGSVSWAVLPTENGTTVAVRNADLIAA